MSSSIKILDHNFDPITGYMNMAAVDDETGNHLSTGGFGFRESRYCGKYLRTLTAGGIATPVHNRRGGNVRKMFNTVFEMAPENGWAVSMLHPFSFSYYRMFGYEKIADHRILRFPTRLLSFVPRRCKLVRYDNDEQLADILAIYDEFASKRNIMFRRTNGSMYKKKDKTYIYYDENGKPASYIVYKTYNEYVINHMANSLLTVEEMVFTTPESLRELFSFLYMFEGEMDEIEIANCAMSPEVDLILRHYDQTTYTLVPDIMARILDVKAVLEANEYPEQEGKFTVKVEDTLDFTKGVYQVTYGAGEGVVKKLADNADCDLVAQMPAFTQLVYGYDEYNSFNARFMEGVMLNNDAKDFFRAFPNRPAGLFEHF